MNRRCLIYGRVSSEGDRQSTDRQIYSLTKLIRDNGDTLQHEPFTEHISGAKKNSERVGLMNCLNYAKNNSIDIIYFSSIDRMGRAIWQVLESVKFCLDNHINCYFQKEQMTLYLENGTENPFLSFFISVISTCASIERDSIKFRLNDARNKKIDEAKASGKTLAEAGFGRPKGAVKSKAKKIEEYGQVLKCLRKGKSIRDTAKLCDISVSTVKRLKKEFEITGSE